MQQRSRRRADTGPAAFQLNDSEAPQTREADGRDDDLVARRAYERYEARGREDGHDQEDWFEAERQIRSDVGGQGAPGRERPATAPSA